MISAPLVEELTKVRASCSVFLIWRRTINGTSDGVVYARRSQGFAFVENILTSFRDGGTSGPFCYTRSCPRSPTFTACTGVAIGFSLPPAILSTWAWMAPVGLVGAIVLMRPGTGFVKPRECICWRAGCYNSVRRAEVSWLRWSERGRCVAGWRTTPAPAGPPAEIQMLTTRCWAPVGRRGGRPPGGLQASAAMKTPSRRCCGTGPKATPAERGQSCSGRAVLKGTGFIVGRLAKRTISGPARDGSSRISCDGSGLAA